jgi:Zn-dependent membrane protease YugP
MLNGYYLFTDPSFLIVFVLSLIVMGIASARVNYVFKKYSNVQSSSSLTGAQAAKMILDAEGVRIPDIKQTRGDLDDHYDPRTGELALSQKVYGSHSIAAIGVAAHECGHAIQAAVGYGPVKMRSFLYPAANIGSMFGPYMVFIGLFFNLSWLSTLGIFFFAGAVVFYLVTLPVEFDASKRAIATIRSMNILTEEETESARKVLQAAAMTYVASALVAVLQLLRLVLLSNSRRKD